MTKDELKLALKHAKRDERHLSNAETRYWCDQYKLLATQAIEALAQPEQEPVAWVVEDAHGERLEWASDAHSCHGVPTFPLYTTPPQRKPLTDEKIYSVLENLQIMYNRPPTTDSRIIFARAIEAAHGIKG